METTELQGKRFLQKLLKIQVQIDEKTDEFEYWKKQRVFCDENSQLSRNIRKRAEELHDLVQSMNEQKLLATELIERINDPVARTILLRRYILCDTWTTIAAACGRMSERNAHYIHNQALLEFEDIYRGEKAAFPESESERLF
jgi:hypothetical protein